MVRLTMLVGCFVIAGIALAQDATKVVKCRVGAGGFNGVPPAFGAPPAGGFFGGPPAFGAPPAGGFFGGPPGFGAPGPGGFPGKGGRGGIGIIDPNIYPQAIIAGPHASKAAVVELLEDEGSTIARQLHDGVGPEATTKVGPWYADRYSGNSSFKVAGYQKYRETLPDWRYPIAENPKEGEYRYIRFAWKKPVGNGVMVQLNASNVDWIRYYAGQNNVGFAPAIQVDAQAPRDWTVVTRDLWADFHLNFTLTGFAFTSMDNVAYFDHIYLGRTLEDLDRITQAHQRWSMTPMPLGPAQFNTYWQQLTSSDAAVRMPARWALARSWDSSIVALTEAMQVPDDRTTRERITKALRELDSSRYALREKAYKELEEIGSADMAQLQTALADATRNLELHTRLTKLLEWHRQTPTLNAEQRRQWEVLRVLEQADIKVAEPLLKKLTTAKLPAGVSSEAERILERRTRTP